MQEGRIVHFEDNANLRASLEATVNLFGGPHKVVGEASDLPTALGVLDDIASGKLDANVVLLDGNLSKATSGSDAREITTRISDLKLPVRVLGLSSDAMEKYGVQVDVDITKDRLTHGLLMQVLDELPEPEARA